MKRKCFKLMILSASIFALCVGCQDKEQKAGKQSLEPEQEVTVTGGADEPESLTYTSKVNGIEITVPDASWKCTEDEDGLTTFTSTSGVINIMHMEGEDLQGIQIPDSKDSYETMIKGILADVKCEVKQFEKVDEDGRKGYQAIVSYEDNDPDKYAVGYGTYSDTEGYNIQATLFKDDEALLKAVEQSVFGIKILKSEQ